MIAAFAAKHARTPLRSRLVKASSCARNRARIGSTSGCSAGDASAFATGGTATAAATPATPAIIASLRFITCLLKPIKSNKPSGTEKNKIIESSSVEKLSHWKENGKHEATSVDELG